MAKQDSTSSPRIVKISQHERFDRVNKLGLMLSLHWLKEAGFTQGMPVKYRVMPGCIVITSQTINDLWQTLEGVSQQPLDTSKTLRWLKQFPTGLVID